MLSTFSVINLNSAGAGSLRQAILDANGSPGADVIEFDVAGTISLSGKALPAVTDTVLIDGSTVPGFSGSPLVEVDFNNLGGLRFNAAASGSELTSLALVDAAVSGLTLNDVDDMIVSANFIGLKPDGTTIEANRGYGIDIVNATGNTIGGEGNLISGNKLSGIRVTGGGSNEIWGNYIGTDVTGTLDRGNLQNGILLSGGTTANSIGGELANVISANGENGVLLKNNARLNTIADNIIGLDAAGGAALGNRLDGVKLKGAHDNTIGDIDPVTDVNYYDTASITTMPVSGWQGIRGADTAGQYYITGTSDANGLLFVGTIEGVGTTYSVDYPGAYNSSVYGPDNLDGGDVRLVGSYKNPDYQTASVEVNGYMYEGAVTDTANPANYRQINYPGAKFNYVHSTANGLVVGNYDSPDDHGDFDLPLGPGHAFLYDIASDTFLPDIEYPGALFNSAYGIWYNGDTSYTIVGGYSMDPAANFEDQDKPIDRAFMVDYDSATGQYSHWTSFSYPGANAITHFQGVSSVESGVYTISADALDITSNEPARGSWVTVKRNADGSFGDATWVDLAYPSVDPDTTITSANSVYGNQVVGIVLGVDPAINYQATVNLGFELSNVISGNGANGIGLYGSHTNFIAQNYIGTDLTGTVDLGNAQNGILVTEGSNANLIGGQVSGGNDPTGGTFVQPPLGNVISGNDANGVLINAQSKQNQLSGNFIGTDATGDAALGNAADGVAIVNANQNSLIGCTFVENPFVYYNVIGANGDNGLRVKNSNGTTIQANFFGMGADNNTALGNAANGVLVEGTSARTTMGGPIPLGNVAAANGANGIFVKDTASYFTSYNTFCGLAAFSDDTNFGNALDGMLITSTGGNILIRTNVVSSNGDDGIEISGQARDVRVAGNIIGLNTDGGLPMGNADNGVEVGGAARQIVIGGPQPTFNVIPQNTISANGGNGVAIVGTAHNVEVSHSYIGTAVSGQQAQGNANDGVYIGPGTYLVTVGSTDPDLATVIGGNASHGIEMVGTRDNKVINSHVGTDSDGVLDLGNAGNGVLISASNDNVIGKVSAASTTPANVIAYNGANGVFVESGFRNTISQNSIFENVALGISLAPGANANAAAPVLTGVATTAQGIEVTGTIMSKPKTTFVIELFASDTNSASGRVYLGSITVKTNAAGVGTFVYTGALPPLGMDFITATATDPNGNTSAFSNAVS